MNFYESLQLLDPEGRLERVRFFEAKIASSPHSSHVPLWRAWAEAFKGNVAGVKSLLVECVARGEPEIRNQAREMLWLFEGDKPSEEAIRELQSLVTLNPTAIFPMYELARIELKLGHLEEAELLLKQALEAIREDSPDMEGLFSIAKEYADLLANRGMVKDAIQVLRNLQARFPERKALSWIVDRLGDQ